MTFQISDIKTALAFGGARPTLFNVALTFPGTVPGGQAAGDASRFLVESAALPASSIAPIEVPYFGRKIRVAGDRTFEPWTVTVINDEDFKIRHAIEAWHNKINSLRDNLNTFNTSAPESYKVVADVFQYSKTGGPAIRNYKFYGMFPTEVTAIDLNWNDTDTIERFQITFVYDYYEVNSAKQGQIAV